MSFPNQSSIFQESTRSFVTWLITAAATCYPLAAMSQNSQMPIVVSSNESATSDLQMTVWPVILLAPEEMLAQPEAADPGNGWTASENFTGEVPGFVSSNSAITPAAQWQGEPQNQILQGENVMLPGEASSPFETDIREEIISEPHPTTPHKPWIIPISTQGTISILPGDGNDLGITDLEIKQTFLIPRAKGWMVSPAFSTTFLNGPTSTDLPPTLYTASIDVMWAKELSPQWKMNLGIAPGIYSDFQNTGSNAYRITGRAIFMWQMNDSWQLAFGAVYLDRDDIVALPAVGAIYTPSETFRVEAVFPRPRVAWRLAQMGDEERWFYLAGELGGGTWAVERESGADDTVTYNALRLLAGYEIKRKGRLSPRIEAGYVFNRRVEYESDVGNFNPTSAAMIRVGLGF